MEADDAAFVDDDDELKPIQRFAHSRCCIPKCCSFDGEEESDIRFYRFPTNPERLNLWRQITGEFRCIDPPLPSYAIICSNHFAIEDFQPNPATTGGWRLQPNSVPKRKIATKPRYFERTPAGQIICSVCEQMCVQQQSTSKRFFTYPVDKKLREKWMEALWGTKNYENNTRRKLKDQLVCSKHFGFDDFEKSATAADAYRRSYDKLYLRPGSVPTRCIFPSTSKDVVDNTNGKNSSDVSLCSIVDGTADVQESQRSFKCVTVNKSNGDYFDGGIYDDVPYVTAHILNVKCPIKQSFFFI